MIFDFNNEYDIPKFKEYVNRLYQEKAVVEVKKKKTKRTLNQNSYLHLLFAWFASETGYSTEEVKVDIFKRLCNRNIFERTVSGKMGEIRTLRSTSDLDTGEMTTAIERFRNWSAAQGIYLPAPHDKEFLLHIQKEIERNIYL